MKEYQVLRIRGVRRSIAVGLAVLAGVRAALGQSVCETDRVVASNGGVFQSFGYSVAVSGETALIGTNNQLGAGSVYVFRFDGPRWVQTQMLVSPHGPGEQDADFGTSVAVDGHVAVIGAPGHVHSPSSEAGAAFVFRFNGSAWVAEQELLASDGGLGFGLSVSISGDVLVAGAGADDDNGPTSGSAYVFRYDPDALSWVEEQKLLASDGASGDFFGASVAIHGQAIVVGANGYDHPGGGDPIPDAGAAYVFRFDSKGQRWIEEQKLVASDPDPLGHFAGSVATRADIALIGARGHDDNGFFSGAAYVFRYNADTPGWVEEQVLLASEGAPGDQFGRAVGLDGDTALIGAYQNDEAGIEHGAAYVFRLIPDGQWVEQQKVLPAPGPWTAFFGFSAALSGDTAVVGAYGENVQAGAAYVYAGLSGIDCNANDRSDSCDILLGAPDSDGDGIPDECECPADLDGNASVGIRDLLALLAAWGACPGCPADLDGDGAVSITDLLALLAAWGPCP